VSVTGGSPSYNYAWSSGGNATTENNLAAGNYTVTVTDANGCTTTAVATITQPPAIILTPSSIQATCGQSNGTVSVSASGGAPSYSYSWSTTPVQTNQNATALPAGNYIVTVTDANGCTVTASVTISNANGPSAAITAQANILCNGGNNGSATVTASAGIPPYSYLWSSGGNSSIENNLVAGIYTVTVTDANACIAIASVTITEPAALNLSPAVISAVSCNGGNDGSASVGVTGGTAPYNYQWSSGGNAATENNLAAGSYTVTVTDVNGCWITATTTIAQPSLLILTASPSDTICYGAGTTLTASPSGGTQPFNYQWSNGANTQSINVSLTTTAIYTVTVTDNNNCVVTSQPITVTVNPALSISAAGNTGICTGASASISAVAAGGDGNYTFTWTPAIGNGSGPYVVTPGVTTVYVVTLTDGCGTLPVSDSVTVTVNPLPVVQFGADNLAGCAPLDVCFSDLSSLASGSISAWAWDFGDNATASSINPCHTYSAPGTYSVTLSVVSNAGCSASLVQNNYITVVPSVVAAFTATPNVTTIDVPLITFTDYSSGATAWQWDFGDGSPGSSAANPTHSYVNMGNYEICLTASNQYGCSDTACSPVIVDMNFTIYIPNVFTPNQDGVNDVFTASGIGIKEFEMIIYDRWGLNIFQTHDIQKGWNGILSNGEPAMMDVFTYLIYATDSRGVKHPYIGSVSLVR
jgi:gliding motility-associated-like protein